MSGLLQVGVACIVLICYLSTATGTGSTSVPHEKIELKVLPQREGQEACSTQRDRQQLQLDIEEVLKRDVVPKLKTEVDKLFYVNSCADIDPNLPSGYYSLNISNRLEQVYCSVNETRCCNDTQSSGNWMRIAYLNMSDPSQECPENWRMLESPIRTCRRRFNTPINSVNYSSYGIPYFRVCGRIVAYHYGTPEGFLGYNNFNQRTIEDAYADGISITHGHPRSHVWTFTADRGYISKSMCGCQSYSTMANKPPFINDNFFCECAYGDLGLPNDFTRFNSVNPLWDGYNCTGTRTSCGSNNPPWFCQQLPHSTTEDIEIRLMGSVDEHNSLEDEDTPVELIEIYVQ